MSNKLIDFIEHSPELIKKAGRDALKDIEDDKARPYVVPVDPRQAFLEGFCLGDGINVPAKRWLVGLIKRLSDDNVTTTQRETARKEAQLILSRAEIEKDASNNG